MRNQYQREKVDLWLVLTLIPTSNGMRSGQYVTLLARHLDCSERAVKDALAVLRRAGYVHTTPGERDRRERQLRVTDRGFRVARAPYGWAVLRLARRLFTTCPSTRVEAEQTTSSMDERIARLLRVEEALTDAGQS